MIKIFAALLNELFEYFKCSRSIYVLESQGKVKESPIQA
jgi:hypothetical protein